MRSQLWHTIAQSERQIDNVEIARQYSFHVVLIVVNKMKEHMKRNNEVLEKMVEKLEQAYFSKE